MKKSQFIVKQKNNDDKSVLIYSTFTTSIVELESKIYSDIFENNLYNEYPDEVNALYEMGFLIDDGRDELKELENLRIQSNNANKADPTYYIICPTTGCNARCYYCFEKGAIQKRMNRETADAVVKFIIENHDPNNLVIQWFGGEPLLEPDTISYIVDELHKNNVYFDSKIITNGFLLNDDIVRRAKEYWNVKIIQITIDALYDEYNRIKDYVYSNVNPFEVVMSNIERCLSAGIHIRIRINFNPVDYSDAIKSVDYLKERFGDNPYFFVYLASIDSEDIPSITEDFKNKAKHPLIALLDAEEEFCSFGNYNIKDTDDSPYESILKKYYLNPIPTSCYGGCESSLTIDSMGNIFNCHRLLGHADKASGNVFTGRVNNDIAKFYADPYIKDEDCNKCNLLPLCHGGCKYRATQYGKDHACTLIKGAVHELIKRAVKEINEL